MTHHITSVKEIAEDYEKRIKSSKGVLYKTTCSFCGMEANQFAFLDKRNFVPIKGKKFEGKQAVALYGDCCLNDAKRVNEIKSAFVLEKDTDGNDRPRHIPLYDLEDDNEPDEELKKVLEPKIDESADKDKETDRLLVNKDSIEGEIKTGTSAGVEIEDKKIEDGTQEKQEDKKKKSIFG